MFYLALSAPSLRGRGDRRAGAPVSRPQLRCRGTLGESNLVCGRQTIQRRLSRASRAKQGKGTKAKQEKIKIIVPPLPEEVTQLLLADEMQAAAFYDISSVSAAVRESG